MICFENRKTMEKRCLVAARPGFAQIRDYLAEQTVVTCKVEARGWK